MATETRFDEIARLLRENMTHHGSYTQVDVEEALEVLEACVEHGAFSSRTPEVLAGSIEYLIGRRMGANVTQAEIARRHGISAHSVSQIWQKIDEALELDTTGHKRILNEGMQRIYEVLMGGTRLFEQFQWGADTLAHLRALPQIAHAWSLMILPLDMIGIEEDPHFEPAAVVVHDDITQQIRAFDLMDLRYRDVYLVTSQIERAMRSPIDSSRAARPACIRCNEAGLLQIIEGALEELDIEVYHQSSPHMSELLEQLVEFLEVSGSRLFTPSYLSADGVSSPLLEELFSYSAKLWEIAPWEQIVPEVVFEIEISGRSEHVVNLMGQNQEMFGLAIFEDHDSLEHFRELGRQHLGPEVLAELPHSLTLTYMTPDELSAEALAQVEEQGWQVHPDGVYPVVLRTDPGEPSAPTHGEDFTTAALCAAAILESIGGFDERDLQGEGALEASFELGEYEVHVRIPPPGKPHWYDEDFDPLWEIGPETSEPQIQRFMNNLWARFLESVQVEELLEDEVEEQLMDVVFELGIDELGKTPPHLSVEDLERLLLERLPDGFMAPEFDGAAQVRELRVFWAFLREAFGLERPEIEAFLARPELGEELEALMSEALLRDHLFRGRVQTRALEDMFGGAVSEEALLPPRFTPDHVKKED